MHNHTFCFIFAPIRHMIMCLSLLSLALADNAVASPEPQPPVAGRLVMTGSVALSNLINFWAEEFSQRYPLVTVTIADPGGTAGIAALINGSADLVLISIPLSQAQQEAFTARFGYPAEVIPVAMDAVAVYVNDANTFTSITIEELDAIFSSTYRCGAAQPIRTWGTLHAANNLAKRQIKVYGLSVDTGATALFKQAALCGGDFIQDFQALAGPEAVQNALNTDLAGIGFSSSAMRSAGIHALAVAPHKQAAAIAPTPAKIRDGQYPMHRTLSIAVNRPANRLLGPALKAFIDFVLSAEGQSIAVKAGYVALP